jgi:hypothetical protein
MCAMKRGPQPIEEVRFRMQNLETGDWFTMVGDFFETQQELGERINAFVSATGIKLPRVRVWKVFITPSTRVHTSMEP